MYARGFLIGMLNEFYCRCGHAFKKGLELQCLIKFQNGYSEERIWRNQWNIFFQEERMMEGIDDFN